MADKKTTKQTDVDQTPKTETPDTPTDTVAKKEVKEVTDDKSQSSSSPVSNQADIKQDVTVVPTQPAGSITATVADGSAPVEKPGFLAQIRDAGKQVALKQYEKVKEMLKSKGQEVVDQAKEKLTEKANEVTDQATAKIEEAKDNVLKKFKGLV